MGMTMSRDEKASKTGMLKKILNGHQEQAHSPKLRAEMVKDHGAPTYTAAAWKAKRMHREGGRVPVEMIKEKRNTAHRQAARRNGTTRRG